MKRISLQVKLRPGVIIEHKTLGTQYRIIRMTPAGEFEVIHLGGLGSTLMPNDYVRKNYFLLIEETITAQ